MISPLPKPPRLKTPEINKVPLLRVPQPMTGPTESTTSYPPFSALEGVVSIIKPRNKLITL